MDTDACASPIKSKVTATTTEAVLSLLAMAVAVTMHSWTPGSDRATVNVHDVPDPDTAQVRTTPGSGGVGSVAVAVTVAACDVVNPSV